MTVAYNFRRAHASTLWNLRQVSCSIMQAGHKLGHLAEREGGRGEGVHTKTAAIPREHLEKGNSEPHDAIIDMSFELERLNSAYKV